MVEIDRDTLFAPLQACIGAVESRNTLPILAHVLLETGGGKMVATVTDTTLQVSAVVDAGSADGMQATTVSARKLHDLLKRIPEGERITLGLDGTRLRIASAAGKFSLQTLAVTEFPKMAAPTSDAAIVVPEVELKRLLARTRHTMAIKDTRYYLQGTLLSLHDNALAAVSTDGWRLSWARIALQSDALPVAAIIPRKAIDELYRLLSDTDEPVRMYLSPERAAFEFRRVQLITGTIDGRFPDYLKVLKGNGGERFCVDRLLLREALQRIEVLVSKRHGVRWTVGSESLRITSVNDFAEEGEESLSITYSGAAVEAGFNVTFLLDLLESAQSERVAFEFTDTGSMLATIPDSEDFKHVVMPMKL